MINSSFLARIKKYFIQFEAKTDFERIFTMQGETAREMGGKQHIFPGERKIPYQYKGNTRTGVSYQNFCLFR